MKPKLFIFKIVGGFPGLPVSDDPTLYGSQTCGKETMSQVSLAVIHYIGTVS